MDRDIGVIFALKKMRWQLQGMEMKYRKINSVFVVFTTLGVIGCSPSIAIRNRVVNLWPCVTEVENVGFMDLPFPMLLSGKFDSLLDTSWSFGEKSTSPKYGFCAGELQFGMNFLELTDNCGATGLYRRDLVWHTYGCFVSRSENCRYYNVSLQAKRLVDSAASLIPSSCSRYQGEHFQ